MNASSSRNERVCPISKYRKMEADMSFVHFLILGGDGKDAEKRDKASQHSSVNQNHVELLLASKEGDKYPPAANAAKWDPKCRP